MFAAKTSAEDSKRLIRINNSCVLEQRFVCKLKKFSCTCSQLNHGIWFKSIENNIKCIQECQFMKLIEIKLVKVLLVFEHALCEQTRAQSYISPKSLDIRFRSRQRENLSKILKIFSSVFTYLSLTFKRHICVNTNCEKKLSGRKFLEMEFYSPNFTSCCWFYENAS